MRIDKEALLAEANAIEVARYIGMPVEKRGTNYFTRCPGHKNRIGKEDTNMTNCVLYENGYNCRACDPDKVHDVFDMVQEFTGCTFPEALQTVAEIYGGEKMFASNAQHVEKLSLSPEDLKLIGLKASGKKLCPQNASYKHFEPNEGTFIEKIGDEYISMSTPSTDSLIALKKSDEKEFKRLIAAHAKRAGIRYAKAVKEFGSRSAVKANVVYELFEEDGYIDDSVFFGIVNALKEKCFRCKEIYESYKED